MPADIRIRHGWEVRDYLNLSSSQIQQFRQMARKKNWGSFDNDYWEGPGEWNFDVYIETVRHLSKKEIDAYFIAQEPLNTEEAF